MKRKTIVIGGGAAGLMAAVFAAKKGDNVTVYEKNKRVGRKICITGKGRCNLTNNCDVRTVIANTVKNGKFMYSSVTAFPPSEVMRFFENRGLALKTERGNRVFPVSDHASDVVDILLDSAKYEGAEFVNETVSDIIIESGKIKGIITNDRKNVFCDKIIIATGGKSYPLTGSTGDGYRFAEKAGHTIIPVRPSLVPLKTVQHFGYDSDGLLLKNVSLNVHDTKKKKIIYKDFGEVQLMRYGVTGAIILSASANMHDMSKNRYILEFDLKPALSSEKLDERLLREISSLSSGKNNLYKELLKTLMPYALIEDFVKFSQIPKDKLCNTITKEERSRIVMLLKHMTLTVEDFKSIDEAIVTSGGVSVREIDPKTMQSKLIDGLYFAGEIIDVDAYTGGFNLQNAFSSGFAAANN